MGEEQSGPSAYINRELSWLEFNARVLEEAQDNRLPLAERLKFIGIFSSNLDEFFMVRVASLTDQIQAGFTAPDAAGLTPAEQLSKISARVHHLTKKQYSCFNRSIIPGLKHENIQFLKSSELDADQQEFVEKLYWKSIYPVLTPLAIDTSRSFPLVLNRSLNIAVRLAATAGGPSFLATVQVPAVLGRLVELPAPDGQRRHILLEEIIKQYIDTLFKGCRVLAIGCYRITRNADLGFDEEEAEDLLKTIERNLKKRKWGAPVRLEVEAGMPEEVRTILLAALEVAPDNVYEVNGPLDLTVLLKFAGLPEMAEYSYPPVRPDVPPQFGQTESIFQLIAERDILLHHPYESFEPVIDFITQAANDPAVLAIKQTLYRVSGNSPILTALAQAAENGKQVTVLVELKARFDEENNIQWARRLEQAGCHVIYGYLDLKTHCKAVLVVRREDSGIKRYLHLGTGNYNDVTARVYTDFSLLTANTYLASDISALFNMLTGYSQLNLLYKIDVAPQTLRSRFLKLIDDEAKLAPNGGGRIIAKMNSLVDGEIIDALYAASRAGVEIDLIVRGICCLRPGVPGQSERIRVRSIIGRFLEHSRIFYFGHGGEGRYYLSSADWMPRNLDRRVELLFPVEDGGLRGRLADILAAYLRDTEKARILHSNGLYGRVDRRGKEQFGAQEYFLRPASS